MKCPNCPNTTLVMADRQGVEIDYCPSCRGIWLDRGELDKILDKAGNAAQAQVASPAPVAAVQPHPTYVTPVYTDGRSHHHRSYKKSWLSEIFD